ncbi:AAA family ATPase [Kutzneria sp. NPDC052558]|uniref:helix-turn-helix transcriptional regulator n=1 Tax=Kutzneria sp. NPDC052558 TaxID=3364121 RepID=UPI0037C51992
MTLFGRAEEIGLLHRFVEEAADGGRALVVRGEPGVGKTALLDEAAAHAEARGVAVRRVAGAEFSATEDFAALTRLGLPVASSSRLAVAHGVLTALAEAAPVLLIVDDLQWIDRASAQVLAFVARRIADSGIGILGAARFDGGGFPTVDLSPIDQRSAISLLKYHFPAMPERVRRRLAEESEGNPLALLELPTALTPWQRTTVGALPDVLPLSRRLRDAFSSRVIGLPAATRSLLLVAALSGDNAVLADTTGLAPAERLGLVRIDETTGQLSFSHPLIRAAVVELASEVERREVHRRLGHLTEAAGPDERMARLLGESAHTKVRRGSPVDAIGDLLRAADLSPTTRDTRLAEAAYLSTAVTGDLDSAPHLLAQTTESSLTVGLARASQSLHHFGDVAAARRLLTAALKQAPDPTDGTDRTLLEAICHLAQISAFDGQWSHFHEAVGRLCPRPELLAIIESTYADPARCGTAMLDRLDTVLAGLSRAVNPARIVRVAIAATYVDRLPACRTALRRVVSHGRDGGPVASAIEAMFLLGQDAFRAGQWDEARSLAEEGLDLCARHGYQLLAWPGRFLDALIAAARGDRDRVEARIRRMDDWAGGLAHQYACHVRVLDALGRREFEAAYRFGTAITPTGRLASHAPHALWTILDLVEAAVRTGRHAEALAHAASGQEIRAVSARFEFVGRVATALAGRDDAMFAEVLAADGLDRWPFELARAELYHGEILRRQRKPGPAGARLTAAAERFERLGALPWAARARTELRAAGTRALPPKAVVLTSQQREIVTLAAAGLTNKQIGAQLYLSPRTVGAHLYQLFPKLGVTTRAALRDALTTLGEGDATVI